MDFVGNSDLQLKEMLISIGLNDIRELLAVIPEDLILPPPREDDGLSESEGRELMLRLAEQNTFSHFDNYLGAGSYEHYVPALVSSICSQAGFLTAYTPYQAEASQGTLQTIYEFQTVICRLTGLDVANASVYDGASAVAEAALLSKRILKNRTKLLVAHSLHPHYQQVLEQYIEASDIELIKIPCREDGSICYQTFEEKLDEQVIAAIFQYPNFFGLVENLEPFIQALKNQGALTILSSNPLVYGLFKSAGELGADIAVGDCQPFGIPLQFGGAYAGYLATRKELVRQIPGRLVGKTFDRKGKEGFVLTLQAREQHIRREKATSNICSNQALCALASLVAILWYGKNGIHELSLTNFQRANYLKKELESFAKVSSFSSLPVFNEFVVKCDYPVAQLQQHFRRHGIEPGLDLGRYFSHLKNHLLIAVTELKSKEKLDRYLHVAQDILS